MKKSLHLILALIICIGSTQTISAVSPQGGKIRSHQMRKSEKVKVEKIEKTAIKKQPVLGNVKEILSSQKLKDGSEFRIVRLENGVVKKQLVNRKKLQQKISTHSKSISNADLISATAESSINEGFEEWDGETPDWLPDGWVDDSKAGSPSDVTDVWGDEVNFTWTTSKGGHFAPAITGQYCAGVQFATIYQIEEDVNITPPSPQDEWLISPSVTVKQADYVYAFDLYYDPFWARLSEFDDDWNALYGDMHTIVEAYISVDDGDWVKKWDNREDAFSYAEDELYDIEMNSIFPWVKVNIDLKEYVNKDIKVAIRYWDDGGESVYVDNVTVGYRLPGASYRRPEGYLLSGISEDYFSIPGYNVIFGNAYTPTQWNSYIENADNVTWEFDGYGVRNEENPVVTIPYGLYENPILSASGKGGAVEYQLGVAGDENLLAMGGENFWTFEDGDFLFGLGNYDLLYGLSVIPEANAEYVSDYGTFKGIGNYYEKPAGKFMFKTFYVHAGNVVAKTGEPVKLTIYAVDEEGNVGDAIATSEAWSDDFTRLEAEEGDEYIYYTIPFKFKEIDPETGREANSWVEIESAFLAEFSNYESADVFFQGDNRSGENYAYVTLEEGFISMESRGLNTSCLFDMDAVFPYLYAEDNKFAVPENGGVKTFKLESYWLPNDWKFEGLPDWITVNDDFITDEEGGIVTFSVTATALPDGFSGRNADVKIQSFACDQILQFKQGDSSFTGLTFFKTASVKVVRQGNNFVLSYPEETNTVAVYNITGQKIKEYSLSGSTTQTISANDLAKGVYIFKFSGKANESVKVVQ